MDRELEGLGVEPEREGQAGLRVEVDHENPLPELGERHPDGRDGGGLGDATLLVGHRDRAGHGASFGARGAGRVIDPSARSLFCRA